MSKQQDDLLRKAKRIKERAKATRQSTKGKQKDTSFNEAQKHISDIHETYTQVTGTIGWIYNHVINPVISHPWVGKPFQWYRSLWNSVVYIQTEDKSAVFSKKRAGIMVLATLICLRMLPAFLGGTIEFVWDTSRMATSYKTNEIWYLGKSQEIDPVGNIFSAQGCESIECSDQTSIYFRVKPSLAHHIWSIYKNGNVFFPDYVAAGIQNDINKCEVTGYGIRWKFLVRNWDVYPQILAVNCTPLTEEEIKGVRDTPLENDD